jgi:hypothetical protein
MAQTFNGTDGTQVVPAATAAFTVKTSAGGLATSGVVMLVGEADGGPDWSLETIATLKSGFGPNQESAVKAKYVSGPLVEAYRAAAQPLLDENVTGAPAKLILIKTNPSTKASISLLRYDGSAYGTIYDKGYGKPGNLISRDVAVSVAEVIPTTGPFTWIPSVGTVDVAYRVNGGAQLTANHAANATPAAAVATTDGLAGVAATGGALLVTIQNSVGNLSLTVVSGNQVTIAYTGTFTNTPVVGSTLVIPAGSVIQGAANANVGAYVVTAATTNSISCTKLSDAGKGGAVIGVITAPANVGSVGVSATANNDMTNYGLVTISLEAANPTPGLGKSLEIGQLTSGTDLLSRIAYNLSTSVVTWVSATGAPKLLTSAAEYKAALTLARQSDDISETLSAGGDIGLKVSYLGTTASMTINDTTLTTSITGGTGANLSLTLKDYSTISDLAAYINAQTGYKATPGSAALGQLPPAALDDGTFNICSQFGEYNGRIKVDAYKFFKVVNEQSVLVQLGNPPLQVGAGLPGPTSATAFLSGGTKGGTTAAAFQNAINVLKKINGNFLVPCMSRDATADITDALTESSSTYTIDAIHAVCRSHVVAMSKRLAKKSRQAFLSIRDSYANAKTKAAAMANFRCSMSFLDQKVVDVNGNVTQMQPYIDAAIAAGGQSAAFYKALVKKQKNISGSLQAAGDWDDQDDDLMADALLAGLLPTRNREDGGFEYASDQTTYIKDANFIYNSIQAVYVSDIVAQSTRVAFEDRYVGQSQADVSASEALTFLEAQMQEYMRLKLLAASDDAPQGFKNAKITISGPTMFVEAEVKVAGTIYFIPISFVVSMVKQSAQQG